MSRILKRPMFRIGGSANNGIMSMAAPRRNYGDGTDLDDTYSRNLDFFQKAAGPGPSVRSDFGDLLISGGLNLLSGKGAGKGTLGALATSYSDPYQTFSKARSAEEANQRQVRLGALTQAIKSTDAQRLANMKLKAEQIRADNLQFNQNKVLEEANRKNFVEALGLGYTGYEIYETRKKLRNKGEIVSDRLVATKEINKKNIPIASEVGQIPEGHIFYDEKGKFYRKTLENYVLINELGDPITSDKKTTEDNKKVNSNIMDNRSGKSPILNQELVDNLKKWGKGEQSYPFVSP